MAEPNYQPLYAPTGRPYRDDAIVSHSHYRDPIDPACGQCGQSRIWGDAPQPVQRQAIDAIMAAGNRAGLSDRELAHVLAIARHESGFNPSAAAGTTSAHGLGQFIDRTATHYGLTDANRWDADAQAQALVAHFQDNQRLAERRGQTTDEAYLYKYHHDGPSGEYGGLDIARREIVPRLDAMETFVKAHRHHARTAERADASPTAGMGAEPALSFEQQASAQRFKDQLGGHLRQFGMSEQQVDTLAAAAVKERARWGMQGDVQAYYLSKDGSTIAMQQQHGPLREFSVAQALGQGEQAHWREAAQLEQQQQALAAQERQRQPGMAHGAYASRPQESMRLSL